MEESRPYRPSHCQDRLEYWEESWRPEKILCHSNSKDVSPVKTRVKNLNSSNNNDKTEKLHKVYQNLWTDSITELNDLIYAGSKLVSFQMVDAKGTRIKILNLHEN